MPHKHFLCNWGIAEKQLTRRDERNGDIPSHAGVVTPSVEVHSDGIAVSPAGLVIGGSFRVFPLSH